MRRIKAQALPDNHNEREAETFPLPAGSDTEVKEEPSKGGKDQPCLLLSAEAKMGCQVAVGCSS